MTPDIEGFQASDRHGGQTAGANISPKAAATQYQKNPSIL